MNIKTYEKYDFYRRVHPRLIFFPRQTALIVKNKSVTNAHAFHFEMLSKDFIEEI